METLDGKKGIAGSVWERIPSVTTDELTRIRDRCGDKRVELPSCSPLETVWHLRVESGACGGTHQTSCSPLSDVHTTARREVSEGSRIYHQNLFVATMLPSQSYRGLEYVICRHSLSFAHTCQTSFELLVLNSSASHVQIVNLSMTSLRVPLLNRNTSSSFPPSIIKYRDILIHEGTSFSSRMCTVPDLDTAPLRLYRRDITRLVYFILLYLVRSPLFSGPLVHDYSS